MWDVTEQKQQRIFGFLLEMILTCDCADHEFQNGLLHHGYRPLLQSLENKLTVGPPTLPQGVW